uniref:Sulfatase n=1 Tax=Caenorhabditis tropicalis TaxID=1561998 RepID=A0A1I7T7S7_9PELO
MLSNQVLSTTPTEPSHDNTYFKALDKLQTILNSNFQLWRHGDRSALSPLYPIFESNWTFGGGRFGQLTPLGMAQMKDLGALYRKKYVEDQEFLSHRYIGNEV